MLLERKGVGVAWIRAGKATLGEKSDSVLAKGTRTEGKLESEGSVRLDGFFKGTIRVKGDVVVGEGAFLDADIVGRQVLIAGEVRGQVVALGKLEITATGRVFGNIEAAILAVEEGAVLQGDCKMIAKEGGVSPVEDGADEA